MDLGAYANIDDLSDIMMKNGIDVPRLRGLRLMADEQPLTEEDIAEEELYHVRDVYSDGCRSVPRWKPDSSMHVYSWRSDRIVKKYIDENGDLRWDLLHGKHRKAMRFAVKRKKRAVQKQYDAWNKYAGRPYVDGHDYG